MSKRKDGHPFRVVTGINGSPSRADGASLASPIAASAAAPSRTLLLGHPHGHPEILTAQLSRQAVGQTKNEPVGNYQDFHCPA